MKRTLLIAVLILCLSLVGCSSSGGRTVKCTWDNGVIKVNGKAVTLDDYYGYGATFDNGLESYIYGSCVAEDVSLAEFNTVGVAESDMTKFKKAMYFVQFHASEMNMYYLTNKKTNTWTYVHAVCPSTQTPAVAMAQTAYPIVTGVPFGDISTVTINKTLVLSAPDFDVHVRPDAVVIPDYLKISVSTKAECTEPRTIGKKTVYYYNSGKYEYYQYGDLLIQAAMGAPITEYITFK